MEPTKIITFAEALENTGNTDNTKRREAEALIQEEKKNPGFCHAMMQIASNSEYNQNRKFDVTLAAAIQLKNMADYHWKYSTEGDLHKARLFEDEEEEENTEPGILISADDKEFVKSHIVQALVHAPSFGVLAQFEEIIYVVAKYELPENWSNVISEITDLLNMEEEAKVFGGLIALKEVVHRFEYEFKEQRQPLHEIVDNIFPRIEEILLNLIEVKTEEAMRAKNIIIETFYLANQVKLSNRYHDPEKLDVMVNLVVKVFAQELDSEFTKRTDNPDEIAKLMKSIQWKLKKN